jgi:lambda family phage minor tail protein L
VSTVKEKSQEIHGTDPLVSLYTLDMTLLGGPIERFTDAKNGEVSFGGNIYSPVEIEMSGLEINAETSDTSPTVKLTHNGSPITGYLDDFDDLNGATFTRIRTYQSFLDVVSGGTTPDDTQFYGPDMFFIERMSHLDATSLEFELSTMLNVRDLMWPTLLILRDICSYQYRTYDPTIPGFVAGQCPWNGGTYYDANNQVTLNPALDVCSQKRAGCKARYGANAVLPFRGFMGIRRAK